MIELKNITATSKGRKLFENFTFRIAKGEHWVIQGKNGSGKTSLLQLLAGVVHPTEGHIHHSFIHGNDWDTLHQQRVEKIHYIPSQWIQTFLSGFSDLFYQQRYYSIDDREIPAVKDLFGEDVQKLRSAGFSENFNIGNLLELPVIRLSNGQLKKVIILRQLVRSIPKFLLLDYPFDGLDAQSRHDLSAFIDDIAEKFATQIVMVDHGPYLPRVINRRLVLDKFTILREERTSGNEMPLTPTETVHIHNPAVSETPVVEMRDLTIQYSGRKIISNLNWRINRGERWALTGRNGSGKTTLFSLIYADHPMAYSQKVFLFGRRRGTGESIWDIKKRVNYFGPEHIHFLKPSTMFCSAREYILSQRHKDTARLPKLIEFFNAEFFIDEPVRFLSSGQLQLTLLINVFLDDRELLLLDEPFQFLDPDSHERVTTYLSHYLDEDITLVLITHDEKDVIRWTQLRKNL